MDHSPKGHLISHLPVELRLSAWRKALGPTQIFSSAGKSHCSLGRRSVTMFLSTDRSAFPVCEVMRVQDVLGTKISPPSKASTRPAPLDVHTENLRPLRTASLSLDSWEYHPYPTTASVARSLGTRIVSRDHHEGRLTEEEMEAIPDDVPHQLPTSLDPSVYHSLRKAVEHDSQAPSSRRPT